jgi:hypothetical protein
MSNYYEVLGVWRDASANDIELAALTLAEHWQAQLGLDPIAGDWLQIIEQARKTLLDPGARSAYDEQLAAPVEVTPVFSPGFPWRAYLCALLAVPCILSAFVLVLGAIANSSGLLHSRGFRDALLGPMIVVSAVSFGCGLIILLLASQGRKAQRELRLLTMGQNVDPALLARFEAANRLSEFTDGAAWAASGALVVITAFWVWLAALLIGDV